MCNGGPQKHRTAKDWPKARVHRSDPTSHTHGACSKSMQEKPEQSHQENGLSSGQGDLRDHPIRPGCLTNPCYGPTLQHVCRRGSISPICPSLLRRAPLNTKAIILQLNEIYDTRYMEPVKKHFWLVLRLRCASFGMQIWSVW